MKKISFILVAFIALFAACSNPSGTTPPADSGNKKMTTPSDTAKIDTVRGTDSIIKG